MRWPVTDALNKLRGRLDAYDLEHAHFWCTTADGVRIAGTRLGSNPEIAIVLVHGFMAYRTKRKWRILAEGLAERFTVFTFDLRGHGQSEGACTGGDAEKLDVSAVVAYARTHGFGKVVSVGGSLGGIAVIRAAATFKDVDALVAISTPALWGVSDSVAVRRMTFVFMHPVGRALARSLMGTRIHMDWGDPEPPAEMIGRIAPTPVLIVHGADDHFFPAADAELLHERAGHPKRLLLKQRFGHSEDGFTGAFARHLADEIEELLSPAGTLAP